MHKFNKDNITNAKNLRNNPTVPEKILWTKLRKSSILNCKFRRQQPIGPYIVDFICFSKKIIIELDGGQHNSTKGLAYDKNRDEFLKQEGFTVIRIWNNDIYKNLDGVIQKIMQEIIQRTLTPKSKISTLPLREGSLENPKSLKIQCPAKINLDLKIISKREDGFHNLESVMQTISLYDYLTLETSPSEKFEINLSGTSDEIPYNENNLVHKAILLFIETTNLPPHKIEVFIEKNIPVSAGLAGGSTNAAGILKGLNETFHKPLSNAELHKLCAELGSDLNFCLEGGRQMAKGRGEILEPLPFEEFEVSLIKPITLGISAKEAYTKFSQKNANGKPGRDDFKNDLEWAVIDDYEELQQIKKQYPNSMMSGSGSTYFMIGENFAEQEGFWVKNGLKATASGIGISEELEVKSEK